MKITWPVKVLMFVALGLAYLKTAEAMIQFAPRSFLGWSDPTLPILWAYTSALLVEGVALLAFENLVRMTKDTPTRTVSALVAGIAVIFSIAMNIVDQKITDHTFAGGLDTPIGGFMYGLMGLIPIIVAILFGILRIVDSYFPDKSQQNQGGGKQNQGSQQWQVQPSQHNGQSQHQPSQQWQGALNQARQSGQIPAPQGPTNGNGHSDPVRAALGGNGRQYGSMEGVMPRLVEADSEDNPTSPA